MPKGQPKLPLKIGIYRDIRAAFPDMKARAIYSALWDYNRGPTYLRAMIAGAPRIDANGEPDGIVSEEHAKIAAEKLKSLPKRPPRGERVVAA